MTTITLTLNRVQKNFEAKINSIDIPAVNWKAVCCAGFFVTITLLVFYVWQVNSLTHGFYTINNYERQISMLSEENKNLEVSFAESSFMGQALVKIKALNFQKASSLRYIRILDSSAQATQLNKNI